MAAVREADEILKEECTAKIAAQELRLQTELEGAQRQLMAMETELQREKEARLSYMKEKEYHAVELARLESIIKEYEKLHESKQCETQALEAALGDIRSRAFGEERKRIAAEEQLRMQTEQTDRQNVLRMQAETRKHEVEELLKQERDARDTEEAQRRQEAMKRQLQRQELQKNILQQRESYEVEMMQLQMRLKQFEDQRVNVTAPPIPATNFESIEEVTTITTTVGPPAGLVAPRPSSPLPVPCTSVVLSPTAIIPPPPTPPPLPNPNTQVVTSGPVPSGPLSPRSVVIPPPGGMPPPVIVQDMVVLPHPHTISPPRTQPSVVRRLSAPAGTMTAPRSAALPAEPIRPSTPNQSRRVEKHTPRTSATHSTHTITQFPGNNWGRSPAPAAAMFGQPPANSGEFNPAQTTKW
eukprot:TRINITY_DN58431_c0_g1_i3.p1 TRINITY_DN58431_c0_g1~~TRINITY_DN58431_c0_g1_i3.p1  ORF type:complete len:424 (+),score=58.20 TRINITY_DN58431_c0_g1_i3:40-1272(+)